MNNQKTQVTFTINWYSSMINQPVTISVSMEQQSHREKHGYSVKKTIQNDLHESLG